MPVFTFWSKKTDGLKEQWKRPFMSIITDHRGTIIKQRGWLTTSIVSLEIPSQAPQPLLTSRITSINPMISWGNITQWFHPKPLVVLTHAFSPQAKNTLHGDIRSAAKITGFSLPTEDDITTSHSLSTARNIIKHPSHPEIFYSQFQNHKLLYAVTVTESQRQHNQSWFKKKCDLWFLSSITYCRCCSLQRRPGFVCNK